jgi:NodT family efflux transporter outer membrane factor (OMF) lipoprotein
VLTNPRYKVIQPIKSKLADITDIKMVRLFNVNVWRARLFVAALLCASCSPLGPDYVQPDITWLDQWQTDLYGQLDDDTAVDAPEFWWRMFNDALLDQLIRDARQHNPSLRIAGLRILESRAILGLAKSSLYPQSQQLGGSVTRVDAERVLEGLPDQDNSFTNYQADFTVGWELDFWGRFRRGIESADATYFASVSEQRNAQVLLAAQTADLYFALKTTLARIEIAQQNAKRQQRSLEITQLLFTEGQSSELDLQQANTQYLATLSTIPALEILSTKLANALAILLGQPPGQLSALSLVSAQLPAVEPVTINAVPAQLLMQRPDIQTAAWQVATQSAQIGIAKADFYPALKLFGTIDWNSNDLDTLTDNRTLSGGSAFSWNIFDYGKIRNNVRLQDARLQQLIEQYQNTVLRAAKEIDDAAITVIKTGAQQHYLDKSLIAAERSLALSTIRYSEGYSNFQRVLDAQRAVAAQSEQQVVNQGNHLGAVVELYKAMGGGWSVMSLDEMIPADIQATMKQRSNWGDLFDEPAPAAQSTDAAPK